MHQTYDSFGRTQTGCISHGSHCILTFADTTCSSGSEALKLFRCPDEYLVLTSHRISGITHNQLYMKAVLFMHIRIGSRETRQEVYVSNNTSGFYSSESDLRDLHLLPPDYQAQTSQLNLLKGAKENALCTYSRRKPLPAMPNITPFLLRETNKASTGMMDTWPFQVQRMPVPTLTDHDMKAIGHYLHP